MILLGASLPLFVLPRNRALLSVGAFFVYFFVQVNQTKFSVINNIGRDRIKLNTIIFFTIREPMELFLLT